MHDTPVRMVCFDAGGVLVRICRSWQERCDLAGIDFRWADETQADTEARRAAHADFERGIIEEHTYFTTLAASTDGLYTEDELRAIHVAWIIDEYPGVRALIHALRRIPALSTGLLSNTNAVHWQTPPMMGDKDSALSTLEHPHASHLLGLTKPSPEIFRAFERETDALAPDILFFDDTPENIAAARAAGWRAERIDHTRDIAAQITTHLAAHGIHLPPPS